MKILGLCGSLRANSSNAAILKAAKLVLTDDEWLDFDLANLPYFDPELQFADSLPSAVFEVRALASACDAIFIATPEYAHGLPELLKNALEWIFHERTQRKPVYVAIGSVEGENTKAQLIEILKTMDFEINEEHVLLVKGARTKLGGDGKWLDFDAEARFRNFCDRIQ